LHLDTDTGARAISEPVLREFVESMRQLSILDIRHGFNRLWSIKVFSVIAQHPSLLGVFVPDIPDDWVRKLVGGPSTQLFPELPVLNTGLSEFGLELLLPHLEKIQGLKIDLSGQSSDALKIVADIPHMRFLSFQFGPRSVVRGEDLIRVAKSTPGLAGLDLPVQPPLDITPVQPSAQGVNNATIDEVARLLPKLEMLRLDLSDCSLTEVSLLSLGTHCKELTNYYLSADVSFEQFLQKATPGLFPALEFLEIDLPQSTRRHYQNVDEKARRLMQTAPKLYSFSLGGNSMMNADSEFEQAVSELTDGIR
ncbi:hypothetical protein MMC30_005676, partial [Trapelia coarctata]|nr:hypothetical protein [Trapelia coarctata]